MFKIKTSLAISVIGGLLLQGCGTRPGPSASPRGGESVVNSNLSSLSKDLSPMIVSDRPKRIETTLLGIDREFPIQVQPLLNLDETTWNLGEIKFHQDTNPVFLSIPFLDSALTQQRFLAFGSEKQGKHYLTEIIAKNDLKRKALIFNLTEIAKVNSEVLIAEWKDDAGVERKMVIRLAAHSKGPRIRSSGLGSSFSDERVLKTRGEYIGVSETLTNHSDEEMTVQYRVNGAGWMEQQYKIREYHYSSGRGEVVRYFLSRSTLFVRQLKIQSEGYSAVLPFDGSGQVSFKIPAGQNVSVGWIFESDRYCGLPPEVQLNDEFGLSANLQFSRQVFWNQETLHQDHLSAGGIYPGIRSDIAERPSCQGWVRSFR